MNAYFTYSRRKANSGVCKRAGCALSILTKAFNWASWAGGMDILTKF